MVPWRAGVRAQEDEPPLESCEAQYNGTQCLAGLQGRQGWGPGLIPAWDRRVWLEPQTWEDCPATSRGACSAAKYGGRFIEDIVELLGVLFLDDSVKGEATFGGGTLGHCYYPLVYYVCATAYPTCVSDRGVVVAAPPPPAADAPAGPPLNDSEVTRRREEWERDLELLRRRPVFPCADFCQEMQGCRAALQDGLGRALAGLPEAAWYVGNVSSMFDCSEVEGRIRNNTVSGNCLGRPEAPTPPPSPPPPPLFFAPPPPPYAGGAAARLAWGSLAACAGFILFAALL